MKFIGQTRITSELINISSVIKRSGEGINILFTGFAGCGKTTLAEEFLSMFGNYGVQYPSTRNKFCIFWDQRCEQFPGMFFDEVHKFKNIEALYPIMDSRKKIIVLATNLPELPDALLSRCFIYTFDDYSEEEIAKIIFQYAKSKKFPIEISVAETLSSFARKSPRTAKNIFDRALFIIKNGYYSNTIKGFLAALKDIGIYKGGYTHLDLRYLELLNKNKTMSLDSLSRVLQVNKTTITNEIEPFLVMKNEIEITPRGRRLK